MKDRLGRNIEYLRVSITDRCNLRCLYCMPEAGAEALRPDELLTFGEIQRAVACLARLGIRAVRLTGGEPMARPGCLALVEMLKAVPGIDRVAMTTNGLLLKDRVAQAARAGLDALNISLDALDPDVYRRMSRGGDVGDALATLRQAVACGLRVGVNAVPVRGLNDGELEALAALARSLPVDVRFIELMPVGCGRGLEGLPNDAVAARLERAFGPLAPSEESGPGPAVYYRPEGFQGRVGFISALGHEFCDRCNRVRLTPEGRLKLCLNHRAGLDVRAMLRGGAGDDALACAMGEAIWNKPARHGFAEAISDREFRGMNQFGG